MSTKVITVDPPDGWKYGFPKTLPDGVSYEQLLRDSGYPEEHIPLARRYSWYSEREVDWAEEAAMMMADNLVLRSKIRNLEREVKKLKEESNGTS